MKENNIPKEFNKITGRMLSGGGMVATGDIVHIYESPYPGVCSVFNTRTREYGGCSKSAIKDPQIFEVIEIM